MGNTTKWALMAFTYVVAGACANQADERWLQKHYGGQYRDPTPYIKDSDPLYSFILSIAANGNTQDNTIQGQRVRGVYLIERQGCRHVAVIHLDAPSKREIRADDYRVCGTQISKLNGEIAPSYPDQPDARAALTSARRSGLLYGQQTAWFQNYAIHTRRLGVPGSRPCLPVETRIAYEGRLVLHDVTEVCN